MTKVNLLKNVSEIIDNSVHLINLNKDLSFFNDKDVLSFKDLISILKKFNATFIFQINNIADLESLMPLVDELLIANFNYAFISSNISILKYLQILTSKMCFFITNELTRSELYDIRVNNLGLVVTEVYSYLDEFKNKTIPLYLARNVNFYQNKYIIYYGDLNG